MRRKTTRTVCVAGILALVLALSTSAWGASGVGQWTANGVALRNIAGSGGYQPTVTSDGSGGAIVTWYDGRTSGETDIYAQRVNSAGVPQWTANGVPLRTIAGSDAQDPTITSDGSGGAIVAWQDHRSGTEYDIYAQRVNSAGAVQWTANGVALRSFGSNAFYPTISSDGSGGAIVTWEDNRSAEYDIYAQRVNSAGVVQWTANGVALRSGLASDAQIPTITSDGSGGAIVTWYDHRSGVEDDIYAQRMNSAGAVQWTANGVPLRTIAGSNAQIPTITSDGSGGAIVTWHDARSGVEDDIYAQRVNSAGAVQWTTNGVALCSIAGSNALYPTITSDGAGGAIVTWKDPRSGVEDDIYAQRVNSAGAVQWIANGVALRSGVGSSAEAPTITSDGAGGAIVTWKDVRSAAWDLYAQRVNSAGAVQWTANGVALRSGVGSSADYQTMTPDGSGGAIVAWQDDRSGYQDIYAQRVTTTYTITASAGANGTMSPNGPATVNEGADQSFTITPNTGYHIDTLTVDGNPVTPGSSYTFHSVTGDHTIAASFAANPAPNSTFYFAEGTCRPNFDPYFCIQNPGSTAANVTLTYMKGDGTTANDTVSVAPNSRSTVIPRNKLGTGNDPSHDFSTKVSSDQPIIAERPMYFNYNGVWTGGHDVVGFTQ